MYKLLIFTALFGLSLAAIPGNRQFNSFGSPHYSSASSDDAHAETRALHSDVRYDGFDYALETTNGIHAVQSGDANGNVRGDYEYVSPEGVHVKVVYVADENGFQPQSDVLPTPPPIPAAILKSLEYIRTHPSQEERSVNNYRAPAQSRYRSSAFGRNR